MEPAPERDTDSLFVACVLSFSVGIYLQSLFSPPFLPLILLVLFLVPLAILLDRASHTASVIIVLVAFVLIGALRFAFVDQYRTVVQIPGERGVFIGSIVESGPQLKVVSLSFPEELEGLRVAFPTGAALSVSDKVRLSGKIKELNPVFQNPGMRSWRSAKAIEGVHYEIKGEVLSAVPGKSWVGRARRYLRENIERSGALHQDILKALTIGDRTAIPPDKNDLFTRTGTSHVLAISGFNVGIISGFFFFLVRLVVRRVPRFRLSGRDTGLAALITIPFPFVFMFVAGAGVSVIRATIMGAVFMTALFLERQKDFYTTAALAALVILLIYPHSLFTPSFQLTFMSLLFIVMVMSRLFPVLARAKSRVFTWSASTILTTAAATAGTAPIVIYYFYGINPLCIIHNLVTIPLLGIGATVASLLGMLLSEARYLLVLAGFLVDLDIRIMRAIDVGYLFPVIRPSFPEVLLYYGVLLAALYAGKRRIALLLLPVLLCLASIQGYLSYHQRFNKDLRIQFIDVGMGDSTLIEVPGGARILIDSGGLPGSDFDVGRRVVAPFLLYRKVGHLDYVISTHPHIDHLGGLPSILHDFSVAHLVTSGLFPTEQAFLKLLDTARKRGIPHAVWKEGDGIEIGNFALRVLHPSGGQQSGDLNNASLVLRIDYGKTSLILPGDVGKDIEEGLIVSGLPLRADVLKLAHHGSALSNSAHFIYAVAPRFAVLSVAGKQKGLPGHSVVDGIERLGLPLLRTDRDGLIEVRSDGSTIGWKTNRPNPLANVFDWYYTE